MNRLADARCPGCDARYDEHTPVASDTPTPTPGDVSICPYCAHVSTYTDDLLLETAPPEVVSAPEVARVRDALVEYRRRHPDAFRPPG